MLQDKPTKNILFADKILYSKGVYFMDSGKKNKSIDEIIGNNVKTFRKLNGIGRKELAEKFHISDDALYRIEKGETGLSGEYAYIMACEYGCDMNFIYGRIDVEEYILNSMEDLMNRDNKEDIGQKVPRMLRYAAELLESRLKNE